VKSVGEFYGVERHSGRKRSFWRCPSIRLRRCLRARRTTPSARFDRVESRVRSSPFLLFTLFLLRISLDLSVQLKRCRAVHPVKCRRPQSLPPSSTKRIFIFTTSILYISPRSNPDAFSKTILNRSEDSGNTQRTGREEIRKEKIHLGRVVVGAR
jgi:hypothetical protein